jgi:predicted nuclease of restriction endonuclease-like (RecB) superfamily
MPKQPSSLPENYEAFVRGLKERIRTAQVRAALAVNKELVMLYWQIGREILQRQEQEGWGAKVIEQLSKDLKREFPDVTGFSRTNLLYMRAFAEAYPEEQFVQQVVGQIPWGHNVRLLDMVKSPEERLWYAQQTIENGWSRNVLVLQIETGLIHRSGQAVTNFSRTLPSPQSDLAQSLLKDPYNLEFLTISKDAQERELERALVNHIRDFLLELGMGFAFLGNQYPIEVDGREFRLDLLFYHVKLHCYIVVELKMGEFEPEHSGKMNFYVAAVDNILRSPNDNRTIGIILCRSKSKTIVEYSLQGMEGPIGVSAFTLPAPLNENLPTVEQLEMELNAVEMPPEGDSSPIEP